MLHLDRLAHDYAIAADLLGRHAAHIEAAIQRAQERHGEYLDKAARAIADIEAEAIVVIGDNPEMFRSPRSLEVHGICMGLRKRKGTVLIRNAKAVLDKIKRLLTPDRAATCIRIKEEPDKEGLAKLPAADLKRLGVEIVEAGDEAYIKPIAAAEGIAKAALDRARKGVSDA